MSLIPFLHLQNFGYDVEDESGFDFPFGTSAWRVLDIFNSRKL